MTERFVASAWLTLPGGFWKATCIVHAVFCSVRTVCIPWQLLVCDATRGVPHMWKSSVPD